MKVLNSIVGGMNNNRLTSNGSSISVEDKAVLNSNIEKLMQGPSNFELKEDGRIFIKSLNKYYSNKIKIRLELMDEKGRIIKSFSSADDCAKYLMVSPMTITLRLRKDKPFLFDNKMVSLKKSTDIPV